MKKKCKVAFIDLDGTLLSVFGNKYTTEAQLAIEKLQNNNIIPIITTGRHQDAVFPIAKALKINYFVANNGCFIFDIKKNKTISEQIFKFSKIAHIISIFIAKKINFLIFIKDKKHSVYQSQNFFFKILSKFQNLYNINDFDYDFFKKEDPWIYKLLVLKKSEFNLLFDSEKDFSIFSETFNFVQTINAKWSTGYFNGWLITLGKMNKLTSAEIILDKFKINLKEVAAFGDSWNDFELLKKVAYPIVMKSAPQELKDIAIYITNGKFKKQFLDGVNYLLTKKK